LLEEGGKVISAKDAAPYASGLFAHYLGDPVQTRGRKAALDHFSDQPLY
jgi:hypothetical protein